MSTLSYKFVYSMSEGTTWGDPRGACEMGTKIKPDESEKYRVEFAFIRGLTHIAQTYVWVSRGDKRNLFQKTQGLS
jgi:hypothetical protein